MVAAAMATIVIELENLLSHTMVSFRFAVGYCNDPRTPNRLGW